MTYQVHVTLTDSQYTRLSRQASRKNMPIEAVVGEALLRHLYLLEAMERESSEDSKKWLETVDWRLIQSYDE